MQRNTRCGQVTRGLLLVLVLSGILFPDAVLCETYGVKEADGSFVAKLDVVIDSKEVTIKKVDPHEKFGQFSLKLNQSNRNLLRNVALLNVIWVAPGNRESRAVPFAGPTYDRNTNVFQEPMMKSTALKIVDRSNHRLFAGKKLADLFSIQVDRRPVVSAESATEKERTVRLEGRDVSVNVDRTSVVFNDNNLKRGEIINVDNRSGQEQTIGVDIPQEGFVLGQIRRRPEQTKIPKEEWKRFALPAGQGIFIVLIPEPEPSLLSRLNGKEVIIRVFQGHDVRATRIPIEISSALRSSVSAGVTPVAEPPVVKEDPVPLRSNPALSKPVRPESNSPRSEIRSGIWLWVVQLANLILLVFLAVYTIFFMLPKVQVLEDRVAKSEMFLHGSREAIREELDQIKREIIKQCQHDETQE